MPLIVALTVGLIYVAALGDVSTAASIALVVVVVAVWTVFSGVMLRSSRRPGERN